MAEAPATPINPASKPKKTTKKKAVPWDRDGVDGGNSSMDIVLEWLSSDSNYQQWRGDLEEGKTKKSLCSEILQIMIVSGITHRITQKISDLQSLYNTARDWKRNTGAGILESDAVNGVKTVEVGRSSTKNRKGQKKANPEEFYMKSVIVKRQAEMTKARAEASKAKVSYMMELRELGLEYSKIKKAVDEEFPAIPDILADSQEDESDSDEDSS
ncbi:hypothetical protein PtA15_3A816 [Puccinia triticina]|uniref:No apical meristem-associated C-terminal domain-containing protein n=1 Tax=Puccinia triticina TaxID=208348 RepID=A0ABY7CFA5_9BASI|nr:uncharacterized protein PtA15_3A816 [Puccinia triticina]WAQ83445.1 hypothetical protein PtA15_3A816 [Puccinia triticina]